MQHLAGEEHNLVLLRNDGLIRAFAHVFTVLQTGIVDPQLPAFEAAWFAMEEVDEREIARRHTLAAVVAMKVEEIAFIAGRDLRLHACDGELFHPEFPQYFWQGSADALEH